jgi:hypothetical protein
MPDDGLPLPEPGVDAAPGTDAKALPAMRNRAEAVAMTKRFI